MLLVHLAPARFSTQPGLLLVHLGPVRGRPLPVERAKKEGTPKMQTKGAGEDGEGEEEDAA